MVGLYMRETTVAASMANVNEEDGRLEGESSELPAKKQRFYFESDMLALKSNPE